MKHRWLKDWPWETVVTINAGLCKQKNALRKPTSDGYQPAQTLWENSRARELTLRESLNRRGIHLALIEPPDGAESELVPIGLDGRSHDQFDGEV